MRAYFTPRRIAASLAAAAVIATAVFVITSRGTEGTDPLGVSRDLSEQAQTAMTASNQTSPWANAPLAFRTAMTQLDTTLRATALQSGLAGLRSSLLNSINTSNDAARGMYVEWIARRSYHSAGDLLINAMEVGDTEVRRKAAGALSALKCLAISANVPSFAVRLTTLRDAEADPDIHQDLIDLCAMYGI